MPTFPENALADAAGLARAPTFSARAGWVLFDWASQPFYTLVLTFLFAPYFAGGFLGDPVRGQALWGYALSASGLLIAVLAPLAGAVADAGGRRKPWIAGFSVLLVAGMAGLWFADPAAPSRVWLVLGCLVAAYVGAEAATVFTNAMMTGLAAPGRLGRLSGTGWAVGYAGGLASLILMIGLLVPAPGGDTTLLGARPLLHLDAATRAADRLVGPYSALWYLAFVWPLFVFTPDRLRTGVTMRRALKAAPASLMATARSLTGYRDVAWFLAARMLYADGLAAVFAFGGLYAASVFGWQASELGVFAIVLTVAGALGAVAGGHLDDALGSRRVIVATLAMLLVAVIGVVSIDGSHVAFVVDVAPRVPGGGLFAATGERAMIGFAVLIGLASGPLQSASRSYLARLAPPDKLTEFFGFYAFSGKATAFAAPFAIAAVTTVSGSQRLGVLVVIVFLVAGWCVLGKVKNPA